MKPVAETSTYPAASKILFAHARFVTHMALLSYNRKLLWVVIPAVVWAWLGLALALGPPPGRGGIRGEGPVRLGIGPAGEGVFIAGALKRAAEVDDRLVLTMELAPGAVREVLGRGDQPVRNLPPGLAVEYVAPGALPAGPPQFNLRSGQRNARRLPSGAHGVLTSRFLLKYEERGVRVIPRPFDMPPPRGDGWPGRERLRDRVRERMQERQDRRRPPQPGLPGTGPGAPRPPQGQRGGDGARPGPPAGPGGDGSRR